MRHTPLAPHTLVHSTIHRSQPLPSAPCRRAALPSARTTAATPVPPLLPPTAAAKDPPSRSRPWGGWGMLDKLNHTTARAAATATTSTVPSQHDQHFIRFRHAASRRLGLQRACAAWCHRPASLCHLGAYLLFLSTCPDFPSPLCRCQPSTTLSPVMASRPMRKQGQGSIAPLLDKCNQNDAHPPSKTSPLRPISATDGLFDDDSLGPAPGHQPHCHHILQSNLLKFCPTSQRAILSLWRCAPQADPDLLSLCPPRPRPLWPPAAVAAQLMHDVLNSCWAATSPPSERRPPLLPVFWAKLAHPRPAPLS